MIRYLVVAALCWVLATSILFFLGAFTAATINPVDWAPPGRFFIGLLSVAAGVGCGVWAFKKIEDYHYLIRIDIAAREASARWHQHWVRRSEVDQ